MKYGMKKAELLADRFLIVKRSYNNNISNYLFGWHWGLNSRLHLC
jgi:hypothetical protein